MKVNRRKRYFRVGIVRVNGQYASQQRFYFSIAAKIPILPCHLLQRESVARVKIQRTLEVPRGLFPPALPPLDVARELEYRRIIRQALTSNFQFV